jgi:hypothetical protein
VFPESYRDCAPAAGEIAGATAVMSLSRLWQKRVKKGEARQMLAEIYNWFTEGFGAKDL